MEDETACVKRGKKPDCLAHLASVYNKVRNALLHLFFIYCLYAQWWNLQILCKTTCRVTWVTWITNTEEWISVNFFLILHGYTKIIVKLLENFQFWKKILKTWKKYLQVVSWYYGIRKIRILHHPPSRLCITQRNETTALLLLETFSSARCSKVVLQCEDLQKTAHRYYQKQRCWRYDGVSKANLPQLKRY